MTTRKNRRPTLVASDVAPLLGPRVMGVVLQPASAGRKTVNIMTRRKKRNLPEQMVRKTQQADQTLAEGDDVAEVLRDLNITEATYYRWRDHHGGLKGEDSKKLKAWEKESLKKPSSRS